MQKSKEFVSYFKEIGRDLINLEINTIEKKQLTARKMPPLPHALIDIAESYRDKLIEKLDLESFWQLSNEEERKKWKIEFKSEGKNVDWQKITVHTGSDTFDKLRWAATHALRAPEVSDYFNDADLVILYRIVRNCDQIKSIIKELKESEEDGKTNPWKELLKNKSRMDLQGETLHNMSIGEVLVSHILTIRKIWEIGVENVLMQTVIQIDGDVITRIQSGLKSNKQEQILKIHQQNVDVSLRYWEKMFNIIGDLIGGFVGVFKRG